jgi:lipopolysaccharide export system protein LptC
MPADVQAQIPAPELPGGPNEREPRRPRAASEHWSIRLRDLLSTYLPLLLMLLLAALTWWLVRITPVPLAARTTELASQAPDYTLGEVELVRYRGDGSLMARIRARELRHYPVGDRVELDAAWLLADHPDGALLAQAERATVTDEGQRVRLEGDVRLSRAATPTQEAFEARTRLLELDTQAGRAWTDEPVQWTQGELRAQAAGLDYDQSGARLQLKGPVRAQLSAPPRVPR